MTRTVAESKLAELCNGFTDEELGEILTLNPTGIDRRRQGEGWTVVEAVLLAARCRLRPGDIFRDA